MIDTSVENFTALEAVETGLIDAIKRGETKVAGSFSIDQSGLKVNKQKFCFKDKFGSLVVGKFVSDEELWNFWKIYRDTEK